MRISSNMLPQCAT